MTTVEWERLSVGEKNILIAEKWMNRPVVSRDMRPFMPPLPTYRD